MADAIDRLDNRLQRAVVPPRNKSILRHELTEEPALPTEIADSDELAELREMPEPVATTVRIDKPIFTKLTELCFRESITRETFLEAAFVLAENDAELMSQLLSIATKHCESRKVAKEERKFQTLLEKRRGRKSSSKTSIR